MTLQQIDYREYAAYARQQQTARRRQAVARHERAWEVVQQIAAFLRREYTPERIIAFGSVTRPDLFGLHSDLDIAVEGIPWPDYLHACNDVEALFPEFKVDLVDMAIVSELMRQRIEEGGRPL